MKVTRNMTQGNIYRAFLTYAVPLLLSSLLSQAYTTIDAVIAGKFISPNALGAISATSAYDLLLNSLFSGFAAGFGIFVAQRFGKGEFTSLRQDVVTMGIFVCGVTLVISTLSVCFRDAIMHYLRVDPLLRSDTRVYFSIYTMGYVFAYLNMLLLQTLYALGCTSVSLYVTLLAAALKTGGNLLCVLVLDWGVAGLAIFSVVSNLAATACYLILLRKAFRELRCEKTPYRFRISAVGSSLRYAVPAAVQQMAFHGVGMLIAPAINGLSAAATTGYNIANRFYSVGTVSLWAVSNAFNCYTAQCVGKSEYRKIHRGLRVGFFLNCLALLPFVLVLAIFARPVASLFFPGGFTGEAFRYAARYAAIYLPLVYVQLGGHRLHCYMRSLGSMKTVLGITVFSSVVRVAATLWLVPRMHIEGAYLGQIVSWAADAVVSIAIVLWLYRTKDQLKAIVERVARKTASR